MVASAEGGTNGTARQRAGARPAEVRGGVPDHQRGRGRARRRAARAALLGEQVPAGPPAQARRRAALLPARGRRPAAPDPLPPLRGRLHHQGRAEAAQGAQAPGRARRSTTTAATDELALPGHAAPRRRPRPRRRRRPRAGGAPASAAAARGAGRLAHGPESRHRLTALSGGRPAGYNGAATTGRSVAQPGSASVWGTGGRRFESGRSDQKSKATFDSWPN